MREPKEPRIKRLINKQWWSALLWALAVILIYKLTGDLGGIGSFVSKMVGVLSPFIGGLVIAFLLYRPCNAIEGFFKRRRARFWQRPARLWSMLIVYTVFLVIVSLIVAVIVPVLVQAVKGLIDSLPIYYKNIINFINAHSGEGEIFESVDIKKIFDTAYQYVVSHLTFTNIVGYVSDIISFGGSLLNVLIAFIISLYMLGGRERLLRAVRRLTFAFLPTRAAELTTHYTRTAGDIFTRYIYSMVLDAVIVSVLLIPGMYISRIPYPLAFAVFVGALNIVPFFGAFFGGAVSVLMLVLVGEWGMAIFLLIYILVIQQVDSNLLQPRIFGQSVGLHPIYVLLAVTVGGGLGGFLGILFGVPTMAVLRILLVDLTAYLQKVRRERAEKEEAEKPEEVRE